TRMAVFIFMPRPSPYPTLFPYTTLFRSSSSFGKFRGLIFRVRIINPLASLICSGDASASFVTETRTLRRSAQTLRLTSSGCFSRSEEHTSELQSRFDIVCRLLLEKKNLLHVVWDYMKGTQPTTAAVIIASVPWALLAIILHLYVIIVSTPFSSACPLIVRALSLSR